METKRIAGGPSLLCFWLIRMDTRWPSFQSQMASALALPSFKQVTNSSFWHSAATSSVAVVGAPTVAPLGPLRA